MTSNHHFPITKDELAEARSHMVHGASLGEAARKLGVDAGELDLALWRDLGCSGPAPYAHAVSRIPRFGG